LLTKAGMFLHEPDKLLFKTQMLLLRGAILLPEPPTMQVRAAMFVNKGGNFMV